MFAHHKSRLRHYFTDAIFFFIALTAANAALQRQSWRTVFRRPISIRGGGSQPKPVILVVGSLNAGLIMVFIAYQLPFNLIVALLQIS